MDQKILKDAIVLHITGVDRPGITSTVAQVVADEGGILVDIGQTVLHGYLTLSAIVKLPPGSDALRKILFSVSRIGFRVELGTLDADTPAYAPGAAPALCVTLIGSLNNGKAVASTAKFFAERQVNIREIRSLAQESLSGLELIVDLPARSQWQASEVAKLRGEILKLASREGVDMAVQSDDIFRRNRRLICMDVDSTFIQMEVIDELARMNGTFERVAQITERAMRGELDFKQALAERVLLLKGLSFAKAEGLLANIPLTPGVEKLVRTLKSLGFHIGLVSGGFDFLVNELKSRFHLDFAVSNQLEVKDGALTGKTLGSVVDAERKAQVLRDMAQAFRCRLEQTVAVGDGANDSLMLQTAGLGIAFQAKPKLQELAHLSLNQSALDSILFLMGYHERDLAGI